MALRAKEQWIEIITQAGVTATDASTYADTLVSEQLSDQDILDLGRSGLTDLGITIMGHQMKLLRIIKAANNTATPAITSSVSEITAPKRKPPDPPSKVTLDMSKTKFLKFITDWEMYKEQCGITTFANHEIYSLCTEPVQTIILNTCPDFKTKSESDLLEFIKSIATEKANPRVHRCQFNKLCQHPGESMKHYATRLQSAAADCEFKCRKCKQDIQEQFIEDQFINGMENARIQTELFAKDPELDAFVDIFNLAERLEGASRDQSLVVSQDDSIARISEYRRMKNSHYSTNAPRKQFPSKKNCTGCGKGPHMNGRKKDCPAWNQKCKSCHKMNHFSSVCRFREQNSQEHVNVISTHCNNNCCSNNSPDSHGCQSFVNNASTSHSNYQGPSASEPGYETLSYLYYSGTTAKDGEPQEIQATLTPLIHDTEQANESTTMLIFPDTGASLCIGGPEHQAMMNIPAEKLAPCSKKVKVAGGTTLECYGFCKVLFNVDGNKVTLPLYFCKTIKRLYFGKEGCVAAKLISANFPHPMPNINHNNQQVNFLSLDSRPIIDHLQVNSIATRTDNTVDLPVCSNKLPCAPTPENIPALKKHLIDTFQSTAFNRSHGGQFPQMTGPPLRIHLKEDAVPKATFKYIPVPHNLVKSTKAGLDRDTKLGVIEPLPIGEEVDWCTQMVVVPKKRKQKDPGSTQHDDDARRAIDFQYLNSQCKREPHVIPSPFALACQVPANQYKTVLDAVDGYHSVPLSQESQRLTNFVTPWGIYRCKRAPQGFFSSGDGYTKRYDSIIKDVPRCYKIVDDTLLHDSSIEEAYWHTWNYLLLCAKNGIVININKFQFCQKTVDFAGLKLTPNGVAPSDQMLSAIKDFPAPRDITGARSWFGLVNQVAWAHTVTSDMQPFRDLIKKNSKFHWSPALQTLFERSKQAIITAVKDGIKSYDPELPTCIQCDWSRTGIGYLLLQKHCQCSMEKAPICCTEGWQIVFAGSRFTKDAESRYSATEGEALAVSWSLNHARMFTLGCSNLLVVTDHKPLLGILQDRNLGSIANRRIQRFKEKTLQFDFRIQYCPGRWNKGADAVSRYPSASLAFITISEESDDHEQDEDALFDIATQKDVICALYAIHDSIPRSFEGTISMAKLEDACRLDDHHQTLLQAVTKGFPLSRHETDPRIRDFWSVKDRLSSNGNIVFLDQRLVIPVKIRQAILRILHSAHQGCSSMARRARECIYWPGMDRDILNLRADCGSCSRNAPSLCKEPLQMSQAPLYPYEQIVADYFHIKGHSYLAIADCFSGYLHSYHFPTSATSTCLINICRDLFINFGTPAVFASDGGPQFIAHSFDEFLKSWGIYHRKSSAGYAQSNGRAELAVKTAKRILCDNMASDGSINNDKVARAMLQYKNTPLPYIDLSPAQLLFHRELKDYMPRPVSAYKLHESWLIQAQQREALLAKRNEQLAAKYNTAAHSLVPLVVGCHVLIQNTSKLRKGKWEKSGRVVEVLPHRQYRVKLDGSGRVSLQNRRFLQEIPKKLANQQMGTFVTSAQPLVQPSRSVPAASTSVANNNQTVQSASEQQHADTFQHDEMPETSSPVSLSTNPVDVTVEQTNESSGPGPLLSRHTPFPLALKRLYSHNPPGRRECISGSSSRIANQQRHLQRDTAD